MQRRNSKLVGPLASVSCEREPTFPESLAINCSGSGPRRDEICGKECEAFEWGARRTLSECQYYRADLGTSRRHNPHPCWSASASFPIPWQWYPMSSKCGQSLAPISVSPQFSRDAVASKQTAKSACETWEKVERGFACKRMQRGLFEPPINSTLAQGVDVSRDS